MLHHAADRSGLLHTGHSEPKSGQEGNENRRKSVMLDIQGQELGIACEGHSGP